MGPQTRFLHTGVERDAATGATVPPIQPAVTFGQEGFAGAGTYDYSRSGNPTREAFEAAMATVEGGTVACAFASGMAALTAVILLLRAGDHLIVTRDCQGGTARLLERVFGRFGIAVSYVETHRIEEVEAAIRPETRAVLIENLSNPFLRLTDTEAVARLAHSRGLMTLVDNTFLTPYLQKPLDLGADLVIHSATKFIGGHGDLTAGVVVVREPGLGEELRFIQNATGGVLSPEGSYLALRGLRTLGVRMERMQTTARTVARFLADHRTVGEVYYPGLPAHPEHERASRLLPGYGSMLSFTLRDPARVPEFVDRLRLPVIGAGLGSVETILSVPVQHCHAALGAEGQKARGIGENLLRLSVGLEEAEDLIQDLWQALEAVAG